MTQEEWLSQYIAAAFAGVELGTGLDIHAAQYPDSLSDSETILSLTAERKDWKQVSSECVSPLSAVIRPTNLLCQ